MIGTSAGGVEALQTLTSQLPQDLPAAVFVVMHLLPSRQSLLPHILNRNGGIRSSHPKHHQQQFEPGHVYVAPPDFHLQVDPGNVLHLSRGPKENNFRPAINVLFRSAAVAYRERVIGVILTGTLEEGVTGLAWVKKYGGVAVVQDPHDARFGDLPQNALEHVVADYVRPVAELAPLLVQLTNGVAPKELRPEGEKPTPWNT